MKKNIVKNLQHNNPESIPGPTSSETNHTLRRAAALSIVMVSGGVLGSMAGYAIGSFTTNHYEHQAIRYQGCVDILENGGTNKDDGCMVPLAEYSLEYDVDLSDITMSDLAKASEDYAAQADNNNPLPMTLFGGFTGLMLGGIAGLIHDGREYNQDLQQPHSSQTVRI